jgi:hypothetical protein
MLYPSIAAGLGNLLKISVHYLRKAIWNLLDETIPGRPGIGRVQLAALPDRESNIWR